MIYMGRSSVSAADLLWPAAFALAFFLSIIFLAKWAIDSGEEERAARRAAVDAGKAAWLQDCKLDVGTCHMQWDKSYSLRRTYVSEQ